MNPNHDPKTGQFTSSLAEDRDALEKMGARGMKASEGLSLLREHNKLKAAAAQGHAAHAARIGTLGQILAGIGLGLAGKLATLSKVRNIR